MPKRDSCWLINDIVIDIDIYQHKKREVKSLD